jgi:PAS domain S-box-containing protein
MFEALLNQASDSFFVHDFNGKFIEVNNGACRTLGYTKEELLQLSVTDIEQDFDLKTAQEQWMKIEPGVPFTLLGHQKRKNGTIFPVEVRFGCAYWKDQKLFMGLARDITERLEAEKEIKLLTERISTATYAAMVGIWDWDITNNHLTWDDQMYKLYNLDRNLFSGAYDAWVMGLHPDDRDSCEEETKRVLLGKKEYDTEFRVVWPDRSVHYLKAAGVVFRDSNGKPVRMVGVNYDITSRKTTENELIMHRDHLEKLVNERTEEVNKYMAETLDLYENAPCGYHSIDQEGRIVRINNTELKWLGYDREELLFSRISQIMTPSSQETIRKNFPIFMKSGDIRDLELEFIKKDGTTFFVSLNGTAIYDKNNNYLFSRSTIFDISERKRAEESLMKAKQEADEANMAKSEFLANMSHEIRTPMNAVLGYTELLESSVTDLTQKNYIETLKTSGKSLLTLINDILDLSKVEAGKLLLEFDYINTNHFFNDFERIFALKIRENKLKFILEIAPGMPGFLYLDEARLRQVVFNLVGNAIKFTCDGQITLKVYCTAPEISSRNETESEKFTDLHIEVIDTGVGISEENQKRIFEPFVQVWENRKFGGTGLGLAISKRLIELMNGSLSLSSAPGKGSIFTISIPDIQVINDFSHSADKNTEDNSRIIFEKSMILIVDDVEINRKFIIDSLSESGLQITEASDGEAGLKLACEKIPDVIITDIRMPVMNGYELLERLKESPVLNHIPVIAYSAEVLKDQKEKIWNSDFSGLLVKPLKIRELYTELMNWLPYTVIKSETEPAPFAGEIVPTETTDLSGLINLLETGLFLKWKKFETRQPLREIHEFANELIETGKAHNSNYLIRYGKELTNAFDSFNIYAILKLLGRYPAIIDDFKKYAENDNMECIDN